MTEIPAAVAREAQKLVQEPTIELFRIDLRPIDINEFYFFTPHVLPGGEKIRHSGDTYEPIQCESEGWEYDGSGPFPEPTLRFNFGGGFLRQQLKAYGNLVGARLTRITIKQQFLDNFPATRNAENIFPPDYFTIVQKTAHTKAYVEFKLNAEADQDGVMLPKMIIQRDTCMSHYRIFVNGAFDYSEADCPYTASACFTYNNSATTDQSKDQCNYQVSGCKKRFPIGPLPFRAFPGILRLQQ